MAEAKAAKAKPAKAGRPKRQGGALMLVGLGLGAGVLMSYALPTGLLLALGLLPSLFAWMTDPTPGRPGARSVLFLNLAALAPSLAELWRSGQGLSGSLILLSDWRTLAFAWAGALAGFALKTALPMVAGLSVDAQAATRRATLDARRTTLVEEWGEPGESAAGSAD
jgi:hypothetical protein